MTLPDHIYCETCGHGTTVGACIIGSESSGWAGVPIPVPISVVIGIKSYPIHSVSDIFSVYCQKHHLSIPPTVDTIVHCSSRFVTGISCGFDPRFSLTPRDFASLHIPEGIRVIDCDSFTFALDPDFVPTIDDCYDGSNEPPNPSIGIVSIHFPSTLESIGTGAFQVCPQLRTVVFSPESRLREIHGFVDCECLRAIEIPASVELIGERTFVSCQGLVDVRFCRPSRLFEIDGFQCCDALEEVEIPASVEVVGSGAFYGCSRLRNVAFQSPSRLRRVLGFAMCRAVREIALEGPALEVVGPKAFARGRTFIGFRSDNAYLGRSRRRVHIQLLPSAGDRAANWHRRSGRRKLY
jgi:hypothetical protein